MIKYETLTGTINISEDYLQKLIGQAVTSCYGVVSLSHTPNISFFIKENTA